MQVRACTPINTHAMYEISNQTRDETIRLLERIQASEEIPVADRLKAKKLKKKFIKSEKL